MALSGKKGSKKPYERFKYARHNMEEAVTAVRGGMKLATAASKYGVPKSTLHTKCTGKVPDHCKMGPRSILTEAEEDHIAKWILNSAQAGFPKHPDEIKDAVQCIIETVPRENPFTENRPGEKWMSLFLKRHPEICKEHIDINSKARGNVTEERLRRWFTEIRTFLKKNNALDVLDRPCSIFSGDETGIETCPKSGLLLGAKSEKNLFEISKSEEKECITVHCTFSATGEMIPPLIVFPYKRIPVNILQSLPDGWRIGRSKNGWMAHATFHEYITNTFYPWCTENKVQFPVLYFLDSQKYHISSELQEFCFQHKIILHSLPPNSTLIMQPCSVTIFEPLKAHWKKVINEHKLQTQKPILKSHFVSLFKIAFDRLQINKETIRIGFAACGLYPFDEDAIDYSKCNSSETTRPFEDLKHPTIDTEDFASAKKVIEHLIGSEQAKLYANIRNANGDEDPVDPVFRLWRICTDYAEGVHILKDIKIIPDTPFEAQSNDKFDIGFNTSSS